MLLVLISVLGVILPNITKKKGHSPLKKLVSGKLFNHLLTLCAMAAAIFVYDRLHKLEALLESSVLPSRALYEPGRADKQRKGQAHGHLSEHDGPNKIRCRIHNIYLLKIKYM